MYYNVVESGLRIRKLRSERNMTRQYLADKIGVSLDALRKIETGVNGAKIDTLVNIADLFHVELDYLICGCEREVKFDRLLAGMAEKEVQFVYKILESVTGNIDLIRN